MNSNSKENDYDNFICEPIFTELFRLLMLTACFVVTLATFETYTRTTNDADLERCEVQCHPTRYKVVAADECYCLPNEAPAYRAKEIQ